MYQQKTLPNGLRIICEPIPNVQSVSLGIWIGTGSRYEYPENGGISHFIEHMLFKGTSTRGARQIAEAIDGVGGQMNAFTTKEYTCYYAKVIDRHIGLGLDLLTGMVFDSQLDPAEIEKEKSVVLEEIKAFEDSPDEIIHEMMAAAILRNHPLALPVLGTPQSVAGFSREALLVYMREQYAPDNIVVAAAGKIDLDRILPEIERCFGGLTGNHQQIMPMLPPAEPALIIRAKEIEQVHLCVGTQGVKRRDPDKYVIFVLDTILGGSVSSRLFQELREERGLVYATGSSHASFKDGGIFSIYAGTSMAHYETVAGLIKGELEAISTHPVTAAELTRAKEQIKGSLYLSLENTSNRMSRIAKMELFEDQLLTPEENIAKIEVVTLAAIENAAQRLFAQQPMALAAIGPFTNESPFLEKHYEEF
jgi:predicted Zn-dependent peptidase